MAIDTKSMRDLVDAAPGDRMVMAKPHFLALVQETSGANIVVEKHHLRALLDAVDLGRVADQLADMSERVRSLAIAA